MIYLTVVSVAAIAALVYLLLRSYEQNAELLDRIQAPEVVVHRRSVSKAEPFQPEDPDIGPWALTDSEDDE